MLEACRESRHSGKLVEKLVEGIAVQVKIQWWRKFVGGIVNKSNISQIFLKIFQIFVIYFASMSKAVWKNSKREGRTQALLQHQQ